MKISKEIENIIKNNHDLNMYIKNKLKSILFGKKNEDQIIQCIPFMLKNTNKYNNSWLENINLFDNKKALLLLTDTIKEISINKYNNEISIYILNY